MQCGCVFLKAIQTISKLCHQFSISRSNTSHKEEGTSLTSLLKEHGSRDKQVQGAQQHPPCCPELSAKGWGYQTQI